MLPAPLVLGRACLVRRLQRLAVAVVEVDAGHGLFGAGPQVRIVGLDRLHVPGVQRRVVRRHRIVRRALEHSELLRLAGDDRDRLHGRGAGADDRHPLAREVDLLVRPVPGVVAVALEGIEALELGQVGRGQAPRRHDAVPGRGAGAVAGLDDPASLRFIEYRRRHARVELDVAAQVEAIRHVVGIAQELRLRGIALAPLPLLLQSLVKLIGILHAFHVAACARIAVPVPRSPDAAAGLEHARHKAHAAQPVQHVQSGEPRADDHGVEGTIASIVPAAVHLRAHADPSSAPDPACYRRIPPPNMPPSMTSSAPVM